MRFNIHRHRALTCVSTSVILFAAFPTSADVIYSENFEQEASLAQHWSTGSTTNYANPFGNFLGRFTNETVRLSIHSEQTGGGTLPPVQDNHVTPKHAEIDFGSPLYEQSGGTSNGPPKIGTNPSLDLSKSGDVIDDGLYHAGTYILTFDLYLFDSWDGNYVNGPDGFAVDINGNRVFDELLNNHDPSLNFRLPDEAPGNLFANASWDDYIYRNIELEFTTTESMDTFTFDFIGKTNQASFDESWGIDNIRVSQMTRAVPAPGSVALLAMGAGLLGKRRR